MNTADNFRQLLRPTATDRTIRLAATTIDTLTTAGASEDIISFVIDAIAVWDAQQYEQREPVIEELKSRNPTWFSTMSHALLNRHYYVRRRFYRIFE